MRTAPVPNFAAIPGMNPGLFIMGGGGDAGGSGAGGGKGNANGQGANGQNGGTDANGGGPGAGSCGAGGTGGCTNCGSNISRGDPVDVTSGEVHTIPTLDFELLGLFQVLFKRGYKSRDRDRDIGLGFGWSHSFGWELIERRGTILVRDAFGLSATFRRPEGPGAIETSGSWAIQQLKDGVYSVDAADDFTHVFKLIDPQQDIYRLTTIFSANRARVDLHYDAQSRLVGATDTVGRRIVFHLNPQGRIAAIEVPEPSGRTIVFARYAYDDEGNLIRAEFADGEILRYAYDLDHQLVEMSYPSGLTFHYVYDAHHRCIETWGDYPDGKDPALSDSVPELLADNQTRAKGIFHVKLTFGPDGYSEAVDSVRLQRYFADEQGRIQKAVGNGGVTSRVYDAAGAIIEHTDAAGATTSYRRNWRGQLLSETDALGRTYTLVRDGMGRVVEAIDPAGGSVTAARDLFGNVLRITNQRGASVLYEYDQRGLLVKKTAPNGGVLTYESDAHGNMTALSMATGGTWRWTYDYWGRPTSRTDPQGGVTYFTFSMGGKLLKRVDPLGGALSYSYDSTGRLKTISDEAGHVTSVEWGGLNWIVSRTEPNGDVFGYRYNREGWCTHFINESGLVHEATYDSSGMVIEERTFDGRIIKIEYDAMSRPILVDDGSGKPIEIVRDAVGQIVEWALPDDTSERLEYDVRGEVIRAVGPGGEVLIDRDACGNIVRETQIVQGQRFVVENEYDMMDMRVALRTSLGHEERVFRDLMGGRTAVDLDDSYHVDFARDPFGYEIRQRMPAGGVIEDELDPLHRLSRRRVISPSAQVQVGHGQPDWIGPTNVPATLDKAFRFTATGELLSSWSRTRGTLTFDYDQRDRLLQRADDKGGAEIYKYDPSSNLFEIGKGGAPRTYGPGDRLATRGGTAYVWDDGGRLIEKRAPGEGVEPWIYEWNGKGMLASVTCPDGKRIDFCYDPFGRRTKKTISVRAATGKLIPRSVTWFVWDKDTMVHEVEQRTDSSGATARRERTYTYENHENVYRPWAQRDVIHAGGEPQVGPWVHYVGDIIETPEELVLADGTVVCELNRTSWGRTTARSAAHAGGGVTTPFRFQGQYEDEETGLAYNRYRYYDPEVGRYISPEPIGLFGNTNLYVYCPNPVGWVDPLGLGPRPRHPLTVSGTDSTGQPLNFNYPNTHPQTGQSTGALAGTPLQLNNGQQGVYSGYAVNGAPTCVGICPPALANQTNCHTEQKALALLADQNPGRLNGATINFGGGYPPCQNCHRAMREFAGANNATINYTYPNGNAIQYTGSGAPGGTGTATAQSQGAQNLLNAYGTSYDAGQQEYRAQCAQCPPLPVV